MKNTLLPGLCAALTALSGVAATGVSAQAASPHLWSIAVHIEYQDGTVYENAVATGVSAEIMPSMLAECGRSHWTGSVVRFHCFPILEGR